MARSPRKTARKNRAPKIAGRPNIETEYRTVVVRAIIAAADALATRGVGVVGRRRLINFLRGNQFPRASERFQGFALLQSHSPGWVEEAVDRLLEEGYLTLSPRSFGSARLLLVSPSGLNTLKQRASVPESILPTRPRLGSNPALEERLRTLRRELAVEEQRAAYGIFPNAVLADLAEKRPKSLAELAEISGLGETRIRKYGRKILAVIRE